MWLSLTCVSIQEWHDQKYWHLGNWYHYAEYCASKYLILKPYQYIHPYMLLCSVYIEIPQI